MAQFTIPGLTDKQGARLAELLQKQLSTYNDLHLTLKHIHWNVVGPNFIGVHEMIDPQVESVRKFADDVAERIAALGASPEGTPGGSGLRWWPKVSKRRWTSRRCSRTGSSSCRVSSSRRL